MDEDALKNLCDIIDKLMNEIHDSFDPGEFDLCKEAGQEVADIIFDKTTTTGQAAFTLGVLLLKFLQTEIEGRERRQEIEDSELDFGLDDSKLW